VGQRRQALRAKQDRLLHAQLPVERLGAALRVAPPLRGRQRCQGVSTGQGPRVRARVRVDRRAHQQDARYTYRVGDCRGKCG